MPLPSITFNRGSGGLGRRLAGEDHISGMVFYQDTLPSGYASDDRIKEFSSLADAEAAGITEGGADVAVMWYHISEFFRLNPKGVLFVGIYAVPGTPSSHTYTEIKTVQTYADGKIRQIGVFLSPLLAGVNTTIIAALQARAVELFQAYQPLVVLAAFDISGVSDLTTLTDLRALTAYYVGVVIGQDGGADGAELYESEEYSITCLGAALGVMSAAPVHESIGYVKKYQISETELDSPAMGNGLLVKNLSSTLLNTLDTEGYIFARKYTGRSGAYLNGAHACVALSSDYAFLESSRTIDKAVRLVYAAMTAELNAPVRVDATSGKLARTYVEYLKAAGDAALSPMAQDGELSGYQTIVDPDQDVLSSNTVMVTLELVPVGVQRQIVVNIGLTTQLSPQ